MRSTSAIVALPPGGTGSGNGTAITVSSSVLPSSGAIKRLADVRSSAVSEREPPDARSSLIEVTSIRAKSSAGRSIGAESAASRRKVDRVFFQAFQ